MSSRSLRPVDIEFIKALQDKVSVVPLIAKADCLMPSEVKKLKEQVTDSTNPSAVLTLNREPSLILFRNERRFSEITLCKFQHIQYDSHF